MFTLTGRTYLAIELTTQVLIVLMKLSDGPRKSQPQNIFLFFVPLGNRTQDIRQAVCKAIALYAL